MPPSTGIAIDRAAQEPLAAPAPAGMVEVDDICDVDPALRSALHGANPAPVAGSARPGRAGIPAPHADDCVEIELTAEQIDALLGGPESL